MCFVLKKRNNFQIPALHYISQARNEFIWKLWVIEFVQSLCNFMRIFKSISLAVLCWLIFFIRVYKQQCKKFRKLSGESLSRPSSNQTWINLSNYVFFRLYIWIKIAIASQLIDNSQLSSSRVFSCIIKHLDLKKYCLLLLTILATHA